MGWYDNEDYSSNPNMRQKDLVLSTNKFCFLQNRTNGAIKTYTGLIMLTISQQESLVVFNPKTKKFEEISDFEKIKQEAYAATVAKIMESVGPDLTAALSATANESVTRAIASAVSPYSMAKGESISKTVDTLLRGTPFDKVIRDISDNSTVE